LAKLPTQADLPPGWTLKDQHIDASPMAAAAQYKRQAARTFTGPTKADYLYAFLMEFDSVQTAHDGLNREALLVMSLMQCTCSAAAVPQLGDEVLGATGPTYDDSGQQGPAAALLWIRSGPLVYQLVAPSMPLLIDLGGKIVKRGRTGA